MTATPESLRTEADKTRRLAGEARRMAELMHQPDVKQQMMAQARVLEHAAGELEDLAGQSERPGTGIGAGDRSALPAREVAGFRLL
jgi:hypothetical protein